MLQFAIAFAMLLLHPVAAILTFITFNIKKLALLQLASQRSRCTASQLSCKTTRCHKKLQAAAAATSHVARNIAYLQPGNQAAT